jgi:tetratricopeptide (TPR) repeat protein
MLNKLFGKNESQNKGTDIDAKIKLQNDFDLDAFWLTREFEFKHQNEKLQFRTNENNPLKFGELVNSIFDIRKEELSLLTVNDGNLRTIEGEDDIWNFEFLQLYNKNENGEYKYFKEGCSGLANQIVLTLSYRTYVNSKTDNDKSISKKDAILIVHLQYPEGLKDKVLYVQTTFCQPTIMLERSKSGINPQPKSLSILIGFDYRPIEETNKEFSSVLNSAKEKLNSNKTNELNYSENALLEVLFHPQIAKEFYFGKMALSENRFWDAIVYFNNSFKVLQQKWWDDKLTDEEFQTLVECSFLIGYCYYELGLYDKAFRYLEFSETNSDNVYRYQTEYINCLIALKDIRSLTFIDHKIETLIKMKEEERTESHYEFQLFLIRRRCYCLIELKLYEQAEEGLFMLLNIDPENEFAKKELEYIKQMKKIRN